MPSSTRNVIVGSLWVFIFVVSVRGLQAALRDVLYLKIVISRDSWIRKWHIELTQVSALQY